MLDVTGNSVLSFGPGVGVATANAAYVTSINSNLGQGGYNSTRITVDADLQGTVLASTGSTFSDAQMSKVVRVAIGKGTSGTAYIQQIQITQEA